MKIMTAQRLLFFLLIGIFAVSSVNKVSAQQQDTLKGTTIDSLPKDFVDRMQDFAKSSSKKSIIEFDADKATILQIKIFDEIKRVMQKAKSYLKKDLDTTGTKVELKEIERDFTIAGDGVFVNSGTAQTFRNLTATSKILFELENKASRRKTGLDASQMALNNFRYQLDSLSSLPALFKFPKDSVTLMGYLKKIAVIAYEIKPIDSALKEANGNIQTLINQVNLTVFRLQSSLEEIESYQKAMANNTYKRDFGNIWAPEGYYRPFNQILSHSMIKGLLTLSFYIENNNGRMIILLLLIVTSFIYLRSLKNIYEERALLKPGFEDQLVLKYPLLSALLIIISLFQFIFLSPPFILNVVFWLISCICVTLIFKHYISKYWMRVWLIMVFFFFFAAFGNMVLQASRMERWLMLVASLIGGIAGCFALIFGPRNELKEKWITYSIGFMVCLEMAAVFANIFGRYNLAKALFISGFLNVVIAILFLWTVRLINEGLSLAFNVYSSPNRKLFYLNYEKVGNRAPLLFYVLLVIGWVILFGRNFPAFEYLARPLIEFFNEERTIGNYTFSINNLMLFFGIMTISVIISKVVSFFASDWHLDKGRGDKSKRQGIGSWLLLVRISILSIGLFLAVGAAGIPMDRFTIVLSALGVGIGFGLQTLVNNLVSGLIIAFEKPVNVGDIVDVDGQGGTMKSIGFRSSIIATWDGADVVMPNGDLLNSHLINWSLGGNKKRIPIVIGIAYNTDLEKCRQLLKEVLDGDDRILKSPAPTIQYEQFGSSTIDLKIYFWTKHIADAAPTRSDLIMAIHTVFKANNIDIPFAQQDVHLHYPDQKDKEVE
jgi:potassium efflux system protein